MPPSSASSFRSPASASAAASSSSSPASLHGALVALEGDSAVITTQLQLLPRAENILILPPLLDRLPKSSRDAPLDPRSFLRHVVSALGLQNDIARAFLHCATPALPRLALVNGGSIAARTVCITTFTDHITQGDVEAAEDLLESLVKEGAGAAARLNVLARRSVMLGNKDSEKEVIVLDHDKALDKIQHDIKTAHTRSSSLQATPPQVLARVAREDDDQSPTLGGRLSQHHLDVVARRGTRRSNISPLIESPLSPDLETDDETIGGEPDEQEEEEEDEEDDEEDEDDGDDDNEKDHEKGLPTRRSPVYSHDSLASATSKRHSQSLTDLTQRSSCSDPSTARLPTTVYNPNAQETPDPDADADEAPRPDTKQTLYPNVANEGLEAILHSEKEVVPSHEPVFEVTEDYIIYIPSGTEGNFLDAVIDSYIDGPSEHLEPAPTPAADFECPPLGKSAIPSVRDHEYDDFDPYRAVHSTSPDPSQSSGRTELAQPGPHSVRIPSIHAPPGLDANKIFVLQHNIRGTAIELQSSLRAFLRTHLSKYEGSSNHYFFGTNDPPPLWNPVFSDDSMPTCGSEHQTLDHIIALGGEDGVSKDFLAQITGQVERLGAKKTGESRSGRLDLR